MSIDDLYADIEDLQQDLDNTIEPTEICCMKLRLFDIRKIFSACEDGRDTDYIKDLQYDYGKKYGGKINVV